MTLAGVPGGRSLGEQAPWAASATRGTLLRVKSHFGKEIRSSARQDFHPYLRMSALYLKSHGGLEEQAFPPCAPDLS